MNRKAHLALFAAIFYAIALMGCASYRAGVPAVQVQGFESVPVNFEHQWNRRTHPFTGAAAIDINGDYRDEIFVGGGQGQADTLFSYQSGKLVNIIDGTGLSSQSATHGTTSLDLDEDGDVDLIIARDDGVYLYLNENGVFTAQKLDIGLPANAVPFDVAVSDFDRDGDGDLYVSVFVDFPSFKSATYNDPDHAKPNLMLRNNGDLTFTDITDSSGTASQQNTFLSAFVDLDGDGWQDLVVAQNTGEIEIFRNKRNATFDAIRVDHGHGFWMGLAIGDIDKDGDQDLLFTNVGSSIPSFLTRGDLRDDQRGSLEWLLLRNDGSFQLTNVTEQYGLAGHGFAWGAAFEDLNLDGELDLLVAQNYIKWPFHKIFKLRAKTFLQLKPENNESRFFQIDDLGLLNRHYGQAPLMVDMNGDGKLDVMWINMDGPVRAFLNIEKGNFIAVQLPDSVAALGAKVRIETSDGLSYTKVVLNSIGMLTDQSNQLVFGLGARDTIERVHIGFSDGTEKVIFDPSVNQILRVADSAK